MKTMKKLVAAMVMGMSATAAVAAAQPMTLPRPKLQLVKLPAAKTPAPAPAAPKTRKLFHVACVGEGMSGFASATFKVEPLWNLNVQLARSAVETRVGPMPLRISGSEIRSMSAPVFRNGPDGKPQVCVTIEAEVKEF